MIYLFCHTISLFSFHRILIDLKDIYPSMTTNEIYDLVLEIKIGSMNVLKFVPKPITNQATPNRMTQLEDSLRKTKEESTSNQHDL